MTMGLKLIYTGGPGALDAEYPNPLYTVGQTYEVLRSQPGYVVMTSNHHFNGLEWSTFSWVDNFRLPDGEALVSAPEASPASEVGRFSHERWNTLVDDAFAEMKKLAQMKGGEYSGDDDRLLNFRRNGANLGLPMETVWAVYAGKHWDAIQQFIKDQRNGKERERLEPIEGRVDDLLVYLLLFKAMLQERGQ
jgi:hypothetical protein